MEALTLPSTAPASTKDAELLEALRDEWRAAEGPLLDRRTPPSRDEVIDAALLVVLKAMRRCGLSITKMASMCNTSRRAIRDTMIRLEAYEPPSRKPSPPIDWSTVPDLGQVPDEDIAERLNCRVERVQRARLKLGFRRTAGRRKKTTA